MMKVPLGDRGEVCRNYVSFYMEFNLLGNVGVDFILLQVIESLSVGPLSALLVKLL